MTDLVRLFVQITLLRRGPQDLPASPVLLFGAAIAYFAVSLAVGKAFPPVQGNWVLPLTVDVLFTFAWYALLLRAVGKPERFLQTTSAVFGYQTVIAPLQIASAHMLRRFGEDASWQLPLSLFVLALVVWLISVATHVVKAALEWSTPACVGLVILQLFSGELLIYALFPNVR